MEKEKTTKIRCPNERCPNRSRVYYRRRTNDFACGGCGTVFDKEGKVVKPGRA
jgi:hypothetical protein